MKHIASYIALTILIGGCQSFQTATLPEKQPLVHYKNGPDKTPPINVKEYNNGVIDDFSKGISRWNTSHGNLGLDIISDTLGIYADQVGPKWEEFYKDFSPLDFSEYQIIVIRAKIDGWRAPLIRLDLVDKGGNITNSKPQMVKVAPNTGYQDYVFRYKNAFKQNWPTKGVVDSTQIVRLRFNINGGKTTPYSGTIYFDDIKVVNKFPL